MVRPYKSAMPLKTISHNFILSKFSFMVLPSRKTFHPENVDDEMCEMENESKRHLFSVCVTCWLSFLFGSINASFGIVRRHSSRFFTLTLSLALSLNIYRQIKQLKFRYSKLLLYEMSVWQVPEWVAENYIHLVCSTIASHTQAYSAEEKYLTDNRRVCNIVRRWR